ncbi:lysozyme inhibitor LprI family protein [Pseudomonas sp. Pseu.R1]|uniref:lysozyme inhibitor LprI family protein n=1 Tax=Pseudomonas sp. Pseu.R1 TaxID=3379818 RepID=UPI003B937AEE
MIKSLLVGAMLTLVSASAFALSCDNPRNAYDRTYCASLKMVQADQDINEQYKKTVSVLNPEQKKKVKDAQIQWIKIRDNACSNDGLLYLDCANEKTEARIVILKAIERECRASGCDDAKLSQVE